MIGEEHETKELYYTPCEGKRYKVPIDVRLVPLMRLIWKAGIHTRSCCEGYTPDPDTMDYFGLEWRAFILFETPKDMISFLSIVYEDSYFPKEIAPHLGAVSGRGLVTFNIEHCNNIDWDTKKIRPGTRPGIKFEPRFIESLVGVFQRHFEKTKS